MPKATNDASTPTVVEADAFIVRDSQGRKRILIGNLWPAESGEWYPGVALYDEHGSERVCLLLGDAGPVLSFAEHGDTRLEVGVYDAVNDSASRVFIEAYTTSSEAGTRPPS